MYAGNLTKKTIAIFVLVFIAVLLLFVFIFLILPANERAIPEYVKTVDYNVTIENSSFNYMYFEISKNTIARFHFINRDKRPYTIEVFKSASPLDEGRLQSYESLRMLRFVVMPKDKNDLFELKHFYKSENPAQRFRKYKKYFVYILCKECASGSNIIKIVVNP